MKIKCPVINDIYLYSQSLERIYARMRKNLFKNPGYQLQLVTPEGQLLIRSPNELENRNEREHTDSCRHAHN